MRSLSKTHGFAIQSSAEAGQPFLSAAAAGDVNGDGLMDFILGAPWFSLRDRPNLGESYVVFGKRNGTAVSLADVQAGRGGFVMRGVASQDYSGMSVAGAGDINGDGLADLLIGAY